jgi:hypothetical protein
MSCVATAISSTAKQHAALGACREVRVAVRCKWGCAPLQPRGRLHVAPVHCMAWKCFGAGGQLFGPACCRCALRTISRDRCNKLSNLVCTDIFSVGACTASGHAWPRPQASVDSNPRKQSVRTGPIHHHKSLSEVGPESNWTPHLAQLTSRLQHEGHPLYTPGLYRHHRVTLAMGQQAGWQQSDCPQPVNSCVRIKCDVPDPRCSGGCAAEMRSGSSTKQASRGASCVWWFI